MNLFDPLNPPLDPVAASAATPATPAPSPFQWGAGGMKRDPLEVRRSIANALMSKGSSTAPVQSWAQGLDRAASGILAGFEGRQLDQERARALYQPQPGANPPAAPPMAASSTTYDGAPASPQPGFGLSNFNPFDW